MSVCAPSLQKLLTNQIQRQIHEKDRANDQDDDTSRLSTWLLWTFWSNCFLTLFFQSMSIGDKKNIQQAVFVASFFLIYLCLKFASFLSCISMQDLDLFKVKL